MGNISLLELDFGDGLVEVLALDSSNLELKGSWLTGSVWAGEGSSTPGRS